MSQVEFEEKLRRFFSARNVFTLAKGRVALYAVLKALGFGDGDEIIVPGYTCMVVPSPILFLGCKTVYVDVDERTYNINPALLESVRSSRTRALIVQHTYGIPADMDQIMNWAQDREIVVIEDCCHAFGGHYRGSLLGTFGVASFFSGQWNKPFSTGLGGMLLVADSPQGIKLADALEELIQQQAYCPGKIRDLMLWSQIQAHRLLVRPWSNTLLTCLYRLFSRMGLMVGSSSNEEYKGRMPEGYFSRMSSCQAALGCREMDRLDENFTARRENTAFYDKHLEETGLAALKLEEWEDPVLMRYPVRVGNKQELLSRALTEGIELGSWFEVPLHPRETDMNVFGYQEGMCPVGEQATREVVNLPVHRSIGADQRSRVMSFLIKYAVPPIN